MAWQSHGLWTGAGCDRHRQQPMKKIKSAKDRNQRLPYSGLLNIVVQRLQLPACGAKTTFSSFLTILVLLIVRM
jgi:hypothetical protein